MTTRESRHKTTAAVTANRASKIALIGLPFDANSSYRKGPGKAPTAVRDTFTHGSLNMTAETGVEFVKNDTLYWQNDIEGDDVQALKQGLRNRLQLLRNNNEIPLFIGGDHSVTYPIVDAMAEYYQDLTILHFDAHPDLYHEFKGNPHSNACPFARIMENKLATRLVQVGIRTMNQHQREQAQKFSVEVFDMRHLEQLQELKIDGPLYISFDIDALDPSCAPGVSHNEPGGLQTRQALNILHQLNCDIVGADIVEYNPDTDINDMTAYVCVKLIKEIAGLIVRNR